MKETKPDFVQDKHLVYLDNLRESGETNMFGAAPYLAYRFSLDRKEAREIVLYWMNSFEERHPV